MCHEWWVSRMYDEREPRRELWDEFEHTRPLSDPRPADEEADFTLGNPDTGPALAERRSRGTASRPVPTRYGGPPVS
jgi:hypothetical protein